MTTYPKPNKKRQTQFHSRDFLFRVCKMVNYSRHETTKSHKSLISNVHQNQGVNIHPLAAKITLQQSCFFFSNEAWRRRRWSWWRWRECACSHRRQQKRVEWKLWKLSLKLCRSKKSHSALSWENFASRQCGQRIQQVGTTKKKAPTTHAPAHHQHTTAKFFSTSAHTSWENESECVLLQGTGITC